MSAGLTIASNREGCARNEKSPVQGSGNCMKAGVIYPESRPTGSVIGTIPVVESRTGMGTDQTIGGWMRSAVSSSVVILCAGLVFLGAPQRLQSQEAAGSSSTAGSVASTNLPEAPVPQPAPQPGVVASNESAEQAAGQSAAPAQNAGAPTAQAPNAAGPGATPAAAPDAGQSSSAAQSTPTETTAQKSQKEIADEQLKQQEKQRVMGVMATFNTTRDPNAVPLSAGQKYKLFLKSASDPWPFLLAGVVGSLDQATNSPPEWGQGWGAYGHRFATSYSDYFIGNFFGNAVLPSLLHEDPRYFQKGKGKVINRILWAAGSSFWCKRDNGGWGPNWANVGGNFIGTAIARLYYPPSERNVKDTLMDGLTVTYEGMPGAELIEFWPDMVRAHRRKQAEKQARLDAAVDKQAAQDKHAAQDKQAAQDAKPQADPN